VQLVLHAGAHNTRNYFSVTAVVRCADNGSTHYTQVIITLELTTATSGNSQHRRMRGPFTLETRTLHPWAENCKMKM
jgi:hypothetical protein